MNICITEIRYELLLRAHNRNIHVTPAGDKFP